MDFLIHLSSTSIISHLLAHQSCPIITNFINRPFPEHQFHSKIRVQLTAHSHGTSSKLGHWSNHQLIHRAPVPNQGTSLTISPFTGHQIQTRTLVQPSAQYQGTSSKPGHWSNHQPIHRAPVPNQELVQPSFKHYI